MKKGGQNSESGAKRQPGPGRSGKSRRKALGKLESWNGT